jgi:hypothetical protein
MRAPLRRSTQADTIGLESVNVIGYGLRVTGTAVDAAVQPAVALVSVGRRVEQDVRGRVGRRLGEGALAAIDSVLDSQLAAQAIDRVVASPLAERAAAGVLEGPLESAVARFLDSPAAERLVARVIDSRMVDEAVVRLLESDDLWLLVDEVARSPAVTAAITQQSLGFADQVADGVRARSRRADLWLESAARRALRRRERAR